MNQEQLTKEEKLSTIIELCDDIDGEALQYIIRSVGMEYQMLKQLMMTMPLEQVEYLLKERKQLV